MKWLIGICVFLALMMTTSVNAQVVIDFEDLVGGSYGVWLPVGYAGLDWDPLWFHWEFEQSPYTPSSGTQRIATHNYGGYIGFPAPVIFDGAYFSGQDYVDVYLEGYLGATLVGTSATLNLSDVPTFLNANFGGLVDTAVVVCSEYNQFAMDDVTYTPKIEVDVDIKGGSCPNPFNPKSKGSVPVAILASEDYDLADIDPASIMLIGVAARDEWILEDSTQPGDYDPAVCDDCFDADDPANFNCDLSDDGIDENDAYCGDGTLELVVNFDTRELADAIAEAGGAEKGECIELLLTGETVDGIPIEGSDSVVVLKAIAPAGP